MQTLAQLRAKPHTSISRVREYLSCPRKYMLHYELRLFPAFRPAALALGTAFHATVDNWLLTDVGRAELEEMFREFLVSELHRGGVTVLFDYEDETEPTFIKRAANMLRAFLSSVKKPDEVLGVEVPFALELVDQETGEVLDVPVIGAMDAVVKDDGQQVVWELKTGAKRWSADQLDYDLQTTMYKTAARELGHGDASLRLIVATKTSPPAIQSVPITRTQADEDELVDLFFSVHRAIEAGVDHRVRSWACRSCGFAGPCGS